MKAAIRYQYGPPEVINIKEVEKPEPKDHEVLVRVLATTVNRTDCAILEGKPFIMRFLTGLRKPNDLIPGTDFAGRIEKLGKTVSKFKVGDEVWGFDDNGTRTQAEFLTISEEKAILTIPKNTNYDDAAASAEGAHYAYNFTNKVKLQPGQKVLVNGASGAIGSAAVQFLKYFGLYVTAVCGTENLELIKSLGADRVIDFEKEDFTKDRELYHYVFDSVGKSTFARCKPLLAENGIYISSELGPYTQNPLLAMITPLTGGKKVIFPVPVNIKASLKFTSKLIEEGKFKPVIDRKYTLNQITEAYRYVASGKKVGNVILSLG